MTVALARAYHTPSARHVSLNASSINASGKTARLSTRAGKTQFSGNTAVFRSTRKYDDKQTVRRTRGVVVDAFFGRVWGWVTGSDSEDPEKMLDQVLQEMETDLAKMKEVSAPVMAQIKDTEKKYIEAQNNSNEWYQKAQLALTKGNEDLARRALERRKAFVETEASIKAQLDAMKKSTLSLKANISALESKYTEAKRNKVSLQARVAAAKTTKEISEMIGGLGMQNGYAAFEAMERKVEKMEAESESINVLAGGDSLEADFMMLEAKFEAEDELEKLKRDMLCSEPERLEKQLRKVEDVFESMDDELDYEMAWLKKDLKKTRDAYR